jgi:hypothetical protein
MSRFTEILTVSPLTDGKTWIIRKKFGYDIGREGGNEYIDVPVGFMTDFASVPRLLWAVIPKWGMYGNAAVIHDFCYWQQHILIKKTKNITTEFITRRRADQIFLEGMKVLHVPWYYAYPMFWAVRAFGWWPWKANRRAKRDGAIKILKRIPKKPIELQGDHPA